MTFLDLFTIIVEMASSLTPEVKTTPRGNAMAHTGTTGSTADQAIRKLRGMAKDSLWYMRQHPHVVRMTNLVEDPAPTLLS